MKKILFSLILGALILPTFALASFDKNLYYGIKGDEVKELQEFLTEQGHYSGPITGNFYSMTLAGVKRFQLANNISPVFGYFGSLSRAKANIVLEGLGVSDTVTDEVGAKIIPEPVAPVATNNDIINKLVEQNSILQQQLTTIQTQTETLTTIQTNTEPVAPVIPPPVVIPEPIKDIKLWDYNIYGSIFEGVPGYVEIYASYSVDGKQQEGVMTMVSDDGEVKENHMNNGCGNDGSGCAFFAYRPTDFKMGHTITLSAGSYSEEFLLK